MLVFVNKLMIYGINYMYGSCGKTVNILWFGEWLRFSCFVDNFFIQLHQWTAPQLSTDLSIASPLSCPQQKYTFLLCYKITFPQFPQHLLLTTLSKK